MESTFFRCKRLRVSPSLLLHFGQSGCPKCFVLKNPLPDDAKIVGVELKPWCGSHVVEFLIESASYPESRPGEYPEMESPQIIEDCPHRR